MAWKKAPPELVTLIDSALEGFQAHRRVMFGYPAYFVNRNMFAGLYEDSLIMRLSPQDKATLLSTFDEASQFEPMPGRPMKEYVALTESLYSDRSTTDEWLRRSYEYARSLPPKEPKPPKQRK